MGAFRGGAFEPTAFFVEETASGSFSASAIILTATPGSLSSDAIVKKTIATVSLGIDFEEWSGGETQTDWLLYGALGLVGFYADATVKGSGSVS